MEAWGLLPWPCGPEGRIWGTGPTGLRPDRGAPALLPSCCRCSSSTLPPRWWCTRWAGFLGCGNVRATWLGLCCCAQGLLGLRESVYAQCRTAVGPYRISAPYPGWRPGMSSRVQETMSQEVFGAAT